MEAKTIVEVVDKLVGATAPIGDSHVDAKRYENLEKMIELADHIVGKIKLVAMDADRHEHSMAKAGARAKRFLEDISDFNED